MRQASGQHLVEDDPQSVDVHSLSGSFGATVELFRTHVGQRPQQPTRRGDRESASEVVIDEVREPKIENLGLSTWVNQDVARLQIAMHHARTMCGMDPVTDPREEIQALAAVAFLMREVVHQTLAIHPLHHQERDPIRGDACLVDRRDLRMLQAPQRLCFASEQFLPTRIISAGAAHHLDRNFAARVLLLRGVDDTHPARSQHPRHPIRPDEFRRRRRQGGRGPRDCADLLP